MKVIATILAVLVLLAVLFFALVFTGAYNVAASESDAGIVEGVFAAMMERSVSARAGGVQVPNLSDSLLLGHGFEHYHAMCVVCHGAPGIPRSEIGAGLNPLPPELAEAAGEWSDAELHWIVKNGIKMTGMPAFGGTHSDEELWSIVAFVRQLPGLSPAAYQARVAELEHGITTPATPGAHTHADGQLHTH